VRESASLGWWPLARLLVRLRLRLLRNGLRARGRVPVGVTIVGVVTSVAYVGLLAQAFSVIAQTVDFAGQAAALALVTGALAFAGVAARAASSEAVRAGSPENEFMLARPLSLAALVTARGAADAVTDPVGALFLLPALIAGAAVWDLGGAAWPVAAATSLLVQIAISMLAYATQIAVVHLVAPRHRRAIWVALRLAAALALATLWMLGTWVLRAPAALAQGLAAAGDWLRWSPGALIVAPLVGVAGGSVAATALGLLVLAVVAGGATLTAAAIARRAGMHGWEEAGAVWAEVGQGPPPRKHPVSAATKDLLLVARDRPQLLALIAMPIIFVGIQIFGAAGWSWSTGSLPRVVCVAYSLALYMATIGPLTHMQAERRAFWILRAVPVPLSRLLAAKARAWAVIVGGTAGVTCAVLSLAVPELSSLDRVGAVLLVTGCAAGACFLAVAMASGGADLSEEQRPAVGPGTIYAFLLVGGLFNFVLVAAPATRLAGLVLYLFAIWAYWRSGIARAEICMDAEALRVRRLRVADGATMLVVYALGYHATASIPVPAGQDGEAMRIAAVVIRIGLTLGLAALAARYLARLSFPGKRMARGRGLLVGAALGLLAGPILRAAFAASGDVAIPHLNPAAFGFVSLALAAEELILRGVIQRAVEQELSNSRARVLAAVVTSGLGLAATVVAGTGAGTGAATGVDVGTLAAAVATQATAALAFALTGCVTASWTARLGIVLIGVGAFP
jgi:hypothetical protein